MPGSRADRITVELKPEVERELANQAAQVAQPAVTESRDQGPPKRRRHPGRKSLAQLFAESPFRGLELDFEREPDLGRYVQL